MLNESSKNKIIRIGITTVGSGIGYSVVKASRLSCLPLYLIGFDINPMAYSLYDCDEHYLVPLISSPAYINSMLKNCEEHKIDVLIPCSDQELEILSKNKNQFIKQGTYVMVGEPDFVRLCRNKLYFSKELSTIFPVITPSYEVQKVSSLVKSSIISFPLIAKPKDGSGTTGVKILNDENDLNDLPDNYLVQPYLFPDKNSPSYEAILESIKLKKLIQQEEISIQFTVSKSQEIISFMASLNKLKDGVPIEIIPFEYNGLKNELLPLIEYLKKKGLTGPLNLQGRLTKDGLRIFEMNGRFTGITALRAMLGFNEVEALIADALDLQYNKDYFNLQVNTSCVGIRQVSERIIRAYSDSALYKFVKEKTGKLPESKRTVLVTGATGWLGRHLVNALVKISDVKKVVVLVRNLDKTKEIFSRLTKEEKLAIKLIKEDEDKFNLSEIDFIYHLLAARNPLNKGEYAKFLDFTKKLAVSALFFEVPSFVYTSSQSVYGFSNDLPWKEDHPPQPETPYAVSKLAGELMLELIASINKATHLSSVRLARLYGAASGLRWEELPHKYALEAASSKPLLVKGKDQIFDFIHIQDAISALLCFLKKPSSEWKNIYNLNSGKQINILELANIAIEVAKEAGVEGSVINFEDLNTPPLKFGMDSSFF